MGKDVDLIGAYSFLDDKISVLEDDLNVDDKAKKHFIAAELDNYKNVKSLIDELRKERNVMTLKDYLSKVEVPTNIRLSHNYLKEHWSGCMEDADFWELTKKFADREVIWVTTCKGWKSLGEEENEPYIEIEIGD